MYKYYIVTVLNIIEREYCNVRVKGEQELADFLMHIDKDKYSINSIEIDDKVFEEDVKAFFKKNTKLETGKE